MRIAARALARPLLSSSSSSVVSTPARVALNSAAYAPVRSALIGSTSPFSTSRNAWTDSEKNADAQKDEQNKVAGEVLGAKEDGKEAKSSSSGGDSNGAVEEFRKTIKEKDGRIKELTDAVLYGKADLQNAQRRAKEEKTQAADYAITKFARDLTSSLDILHLALRSVPEPLRAAPKDAASSEDPRKAISELYSGVELTSKSILDMLKMHGVTSFDPTGEKFNPLEHEAMYQAPVPGKEPGTVLECSKIGFKIKDRVLRAAQVGVVQETS